MYEIFEEYENGFYVGFGFFGFYFYCVVDCVVGLSVVDLGFG